MIAALAMAALIIVLRQPIIGLALHLLAPSEAVACYTRDYFAVRVFSAPASLLNFVVIGWLIGMQNARGPLVIMLVVNATNILLDLWFVLELGMTVEGVALASLIAELVGLALGLVFVRAELRSRPGCWDAARFANVRRYRRLFDVNVFLFLRTMALMFVFAFVTAQGARMGDTILAVNAVLMNFQFFLSYALDGIAYAAEALVGKAVGARDRDGLRLAVKRTLQWSLIVATGFSGVYALAGGTIIDLLTGIEEIRTAARSYLPWLIALPVISVWSFLYDGVYVGATASREMMIVMAGSAALIFLPAWFGLSWLGNHGLWLAFTLFMAARAVGMHAWFRPVAARSLAMRGASA